MPSHCFGWKQTKTRCNSSCKFLGNINCIICANCLDCYGSLDTDCFHDILLIAIWCLASLYTSQASGTLLTEGRATFNGLCRIEYIKSLLFSFYLSFLFWNTKIEEPLCNLVVAKCRMTNLSVRGSLFSRVESQMFGITFLKLDNAELSEIMKLKSINFFVKMSCKTFSNACLTDYISKFIPYHEGKRLHRCFLLP